VRLNIRFKKEILFLGAYMATAENPLKVVPNITKDAGSQELVLKESSNEFFFAVVGHAGSGTSVIAESLQDLLSQTSIGPDKIDAEILKARIVIESWAQKKKLPLPNPGGAKTLDDVELLQNYGDQMRAELCGDKPDYAAVAQQLVLSIRELRAKKVRAPLEAGAVIKPDGKPRAYILDSLRHPDEVKLLQHLYQDAFVLIGVVCAEQKRIGRIMQKYTGANEVDARQFMERDANAKEKHGQHVADAFHLSDYFIDNTVDRTGPSAKHWDVPDKLSRLVKIIAHSELIRPNGEETAMYHAHSAQMQSACLSRQVGAALVDSTGNVVATGCNEAPRAGGGVYGESLGSDNPPDYRCAMFPAQADRFCRNTREQNEIINELIKQIPELNVLSNTRKAGLAVELRTTRIGGLVEFSRAVHAEMDALLSAARKGTSLLASRLFVTTFPCHYCARHIVTAGVDEVQYIEPYPKSLAFNLHQDAIAIEHPDWVAPSKGGDKVLFRPFSGVAPRLYERCFLKDRELKDKNTGIMKIQAPQWGTPWHLSRASYPEMEAKLSEGVKQ
jgi:deoxycytidylate deaminase